MTISVIGLQYLDGSGNLVPVPDPLIVCRGDSVTFHSVTDPDDPAGVPEEDPVWAGSSGATGFGYDNTVAFDTTSTSLTDFKTVTVECGQLITANVLVVELDKIQYRGSNNTYQDAGTVIDIEQFCSMGFKAIAKPAGAIFPPNQPVWSGIATGTGVTIPVNFPTPGSFTVSVTCGATILNLNVNVYATGAYALGEIQNKSAIDPDFFYADDVHVCVGDPMQWRMLNPNPSVLNLVCYSTLAWKIESNDLINQTLAIGTGDSFNYTFSQQGSMTTYFWRDYDGNGQIDFNEASVQANYKSVNLNTHVINVTVSSAVPPLTAAQATAFLSQGNLLIQRRDSAIDRRACAKYVLGALSTFVPTASGGLFPDPPANQADRDQLRSSTPNDQIRVISFFADTHDLGLTVEGNPNSSIVIRLTDGVTWVHELGHGAGLPHAHSTPDYLMYIEPTTGILLENYECDAFEK